MVDIIESPGILVDIIGSPGILVDIIGSPGIQVDSYASVVQRQYLFKDNKNTLVSVQNGARQIRWSTGILKWQDIGHWSRIVLSDEPFLNRDNPWTFNNMSLCNRLKCPVAGLSGLQWVITVTE